MKAAILLGITLLVSSSYSTFLNRRAYQPYRPSRWVPRAFWNPHKRGINSAGMRPFLSRYQRADPQAEMSDYQGDYQDVAADDLENSLYYDLLENNIEKLKDKRGRYGNKYNDNKAYGFWISALNKAGNYKRDGAAELLTPGDEKLKMGE